MARRNAPAVEARRRRRRMTLLWIAVAAAIVVGLIWKEQIALLYVLATVSVTVLLIIVAISDLHDTRAATEPPLDAAAALADGTAAAPLRTSPARTTAKRR